MLETYTTRTGSTERINIVQYEYDTVGNVTIQWNVFPDGSKVATSRSNYNADGLLTWTQQGQAPKQYFAYDGNGQQTHSWQNIPSPIPPSLNNPQKFTTVVNYTFNGYAGPDANGLESAQFNIVSTTEHVDFSTLAALVAPRSPTDNSVSETRTTKNERGQVIESRTKSLDSSGQTFWAITRTAYDSQGRVEYQTDSYQENTPANEMNTPANEIRGTRTHYDELTGRVKRTDRLKGLNISVTTTNGVSQSQFVPSSEGLPLELQSYSTTDVDSLGRTIATTQYADGTEASALKSSTRYNLKGQVTETRQEAWDRSGLNRVVFVTRTIYDDRDRVEFQTDSYLENLTIPGQPPFATRTLYDCHQTRYQ